MSTLEVPLATSTPKVNSTFSLKAISNFQINQSQESELNETDDVIDQTEEDTNTESEYDRFNISNESNATLRSQDEKSSYDDDSDAEPDISLEVDEITAVNADLLKLRSIDTITEESKTAKSSMELLEFHDKEDNIKVKNQICRYTLSKFEPKKKTIKNVSMISEFLEKSDKNTYLEPWPDNVALYQPIDDVQILLNEKANCLAVETYLRMCKLNYKLIYRANAEAMSPTGKVPFIKCGIFVVSDVEGIIQFVHKRGISLTNHFDSVSMCDLQAYTSLIRSILENAELYLLWIDSQTYNDVTKMRYGSVYPWPLNFIQTWTKRRDVIKHLKVWHWYEKTLSDVVKEVENCLQSLSDRLDGNDYFFGKEPTELDALVFGHVMAILQTDSANSYADIVRRFPSLISFTERIKIKYFMFN